MPVLFWIIVFTSLTSILGVGLAGLFFLFSEEARIKWVDSLMSFAIGTMLATCFLVLLPHGIEFSKSGESTFLGMTILIGLIAFFVAEKLLLWRHSHHHSHDQGHCSQSKVSAYLVMLGDSVHNFIDGLLIGGLFLLDFRSGVLMTIAVIVHEIPQELSDFVVLIHKGFSVKRAFVWNLISGFTSVIGGVLGYFIFHTSPLFLVMAIGFSLAAFLYVSLSDLVPSLHEKPQSQDTLKQVALIVLGALLIYGTKEWIHTYEHQIEKIQSIKESTQE